MARKEKNLVSWLLPKLRRISIYWPSKNAARDKAKVKLEVRKTKNGHPVYRVFYKCAECERQGIKKFYTRDETQADHVHPVINPETGFVDWNTLMERLFAKPEGYQILCELHHTQKTIKENNKRDLRKKVKKRLTKSKK